MAPYQETIVEKPPIYQKQLETSFKINVVKQQGWAASSKTIGATGLVHFLISFVVATIVLGCVAGVAGYKHDYKPYKIAELIRITMVKPYKVAA